MRTLGAALLLTIAYLSLSCDVSVSLPSGSHGKTAYAHTEKILSFGERPAGSENLQKVLNYVSTELKKSNWQVQLQTFERNTPKGNVTFVNLIARHAAQDSEELWKRPVKGLLCAHSDSKTIPDITFLGADDAASAVGAIIEIARELHTSSPQQADQLEIVLFDGEEAINKNINPRIGDGLYGSRYYAAQWRARGELPKFGILLDMIGHKDLRIKLPADNNPPELAKALIAAGEAEGGPGIITQGTLGIIDDHIPLNHAGIPTIDMIGDFSRSNWWHTADDTIDIISADSLDFSIRTVLRFLKERL